MSDTSTRSHNPEAVLRARVPNGIPSPLREAIAAAVVDELAESVPMTLKERWHAWKASTPELDGVTLLSWFVTPTFLPGQIYAIRDDDLKLFEALCVGINAAAGAHFVVTESVAAITGILLAIIKCVHNVRRKGVELNRVQGQILIGLKLRPGMSLEGLVMHLNRCRTAGAPEWTPGEVESEVRSLKEARLFDGTLVALVAEDSQGRLSASGV
jgi:hypothetical protein